MGGIKDWLRGRFKGGAWRALEREVKDSRKEIQRDLERRIKGQRKDLEKSLTVSLDIAFETLIPVAQDALMQTLMADIPALIEKRAKEAKGVL